MSDTESFDNDPFAVSKLLTGPPVVLTTEHNGERNGLIVTTAERASIVPSHPRVLVCVWKTNLTYNLLRESGRFTLNLLGHNHMELIKHYGFSSGRDSDKLSDTQYESGKNGCPILKDAIAYLECEVSSSMDGGDMTVFLANVVRGCRLNDGDLIGFGEFVRRMPGSWVPLYEKMMAYVVGEAARAIKTD